MEIGVFVHLSAYRPSIPSMKEKEMLAGLGPLADSASAWSIARPFINQRKVYDCNKSASEALALAEAHRIRIRKEKKGLHQKGSPF